MRRSSLLLALCGVSLLPAAVARADTFTFTAASLGITESGNLTAESNGDGSFTATAISAPDITSLLDAGVVGNDNLLFPSAARLLDVNGLGFSILAGGTNYQVNLFSNLNGYEVLALDPLGNLTDAPATFSLSGGATVTPEPSSLLLLGSGVLSMGAAAVRRRKLHQS